MTDTDKAQNLICSGAELSALAEACEGAPWLALDTEFIREKTYYPELCLLQISWPEGIALVDPLALDSLAPLADLLCKPEIIKLLHAPRQDLEVLAPYFPAGLRPLFDTQLAAALCGAAPQASYSRIVEDVLGHDLGASHARTDWSRRPLSAQQLQYAADDVRYLPQLYQHYSQRLDELGRRDWFEQEMREIEDAPIDVDPDTAWHRVKGGGRLTGRQRAGLQALAAWRERQAIARNLPRKWVLPDEALIGLVRVWPTDAQAIGAVEAMPAKLVGRYAQGLLEALEHALSAEPPAERALEADKDLVKKLGKIVRKRAEQLEIDSTLLATRADLVALAAGDPRCRLLQGWRFAVLGEELQAAL